jgi:hypothetical protein
MKLWIGISLFALGQALGWFQLNLQKISAWWSDKPIVSAFVIGVPTSILFWYAWRIISTEMESVWSARFIGSCVGYVVFSILTWTMLGESMLTTKTMLCLSLSFLIIMIQIFY